VALNLFVNGGLNGSTGKALDPLVVLKASEIRRPANAFTFVDGAERSMESGTFFLNATQTPIQYWFTIPGERDRACGANVAFADGHAEFHQWRYLGRIRMDLRTYFENEADRADLIWVLNRVPDASGR
jgi:prepilin-type processing-associated H-X9-DG protein